METAIQCSPNIQQALVEHQAAEADIDEVKDQRWPQVDIGPQSQPVQFSRGADNKGSSGGITINVTTSIYNWGRVRSTIVGCGLLADAAS